VTACVLPKEGTTVSKEASRSRRDFIRTTGILGAGLGAGLALIGCARNQDSENTKTTNAGSETKENKEPPEVTPSEDLMREHGVLRRALLVYTEIVPRLRADPGSIPPEALERNAKLFRAFGEDYHESKLEEPYIFPAVRQAGGPAAGLADILVIQHRRGHEITDYILAAAQKGNFSAATAEPLAQALEGLVFMYGNHAAREDTIVFPAWKQSLSVEQYDELADKFEEIEQETFGDDGFDEAVREITDIERSLGLADLSLFTAPPPPRS
jgi:hemerythrin-like domain-containing protein